MPDASVRTSPKGRLELTPAYDLPSTVPYGDDRVALSMDGRDANLQRDHFLRFGERHGVRPAAMAAGLDEVSDCVSAWAERVDEIGFDDRTTRRLRSVLFERARRLRD